MLNGFVLAIALILSYLIGSIPTSFLFGKFKKIDIREYGSGNVGATNAYRVLGKMPGVMVLIIDIFKGFFATSMLTNLFYKIPFVSIDYEWFRSLMGFAVIAGHIWAVFLNFKGGKGIAAGAGVLLAVSPQLVLITGAIWLIIFIPFKYVSLASVISIIILPFVIVILNKPLPVVILAVAICIISTYKHMPNLKRLFRGEEHKFAEKAQSS